MGERSTSGASSGNDLVSGIRRPARAAPRRSRRSSSSSRLLPCLKQTVEILAVEEEFTELPATPDWDPDSAELAGSLEIPYRPSADPQVGSGGSQVKQTRAQSGHRHLGNPRH